MTSDDEYSHRNSIYLKTKAIDSRYQNNNSLVQRNNAKTKDSQMLTATFTLTVVLIFCLIGFSIWLSVKVGINGDNIWSAGDVPSLNPPFTLEDLLNPDLQPKSYNVHWIADTHLYVHQDNNGLTTLHDVDLNKTTTIFNTSFINTFSITFVTSCKNYILFSNKKSKNMEEYEFLIYDIMAENITSYFVQSCGKSINQSISFKGDSNTLIFIKDNDICLNEYPYDKPIKITEDGLNNLIFNGYSDRTYTDVLQSHKAYWISPDGNYLAYLQLNCSDVPIQYHQSFEDFDNPFNQKLVLYPQKMAWSDDESGQTKAKLIIIKINDTRDKIFIEQPKEFLNKDHYIVNVVWKDNISLAVMWVNRAQNHSILSICNINGTCYLSHEEHMTGGWIEPWPPILFINKGSSYLTILPKQEGETGEWPHIAMITSAKDESHVEFLTKGQQEITSIEAFDTVNQDLYYISTAGFSQKRFLYRLSLTDKSNVCVSCDLVPACYYASCSFSDSGNYYVLNCLGPDIPYSLLRSTLYAMEDIKLEINKKLWEMQRDLPRVIFKEVPIGNGYNGLAKVTIPPGSDRDQDRKWYPVLFEGPSSPSSQNVDEKFSIGFDTYLASSHNFVYVKIDGRGSSGRGYRFKHMIYRKLVTVDMDDQILAAQWMTTAKHMTDKLLTNLKLADKKRFAIWGKSYGGLIALHALANETNTFNCAVSLGGYTDLRFYASSFIERFMGFPTIQDNLSAYERADILTKTYLFNQKKLLVLHANEDDYVPIASSYHLMQGLNKAGIQYRQNIYPGKNQFNIDKKHLNLLITSFLKDDCFKDIGDNINEEK